jgi:hypothetical protein
MNTRGWNITSWLLLIVWLGCGLLDMWHVRGGLLTSYGADVTLPAWLYIITRSLDNPTRKTILQRFLGRTPELAAGALFMASTFTEIGQWFWPKGLFSGTFDPFDILAYASGIAICYMFDKNSMRKNCF